MQLVLLKNMKQINTYTYGSSHHSILFEAHYKCIGIFTLVWAITLTEKNTKYISKELHSSDTSLKIPQ
jgi:hypothetical protein